MKKITDKILAILSIFLLVGIQAITTTVYAVDVLSEQNSDTEEENVKFDARIGTKEENRGYEYEANIDDTENKMYIEIDVENTGYLKDITINLEENNYIFADVDSYNDKRIKNIEENKIKLNQINAGEDIKLEIPIILEKAERIEKDIYSKESKVKLNAIYVNGENKERKIEKEIKEKLTWKVEEESLGIETSQEVIRYLTYNNQTIISMKVKNKLKDSKVAINKKEMEITVPEINGNKPTQVIVNNISTGNTNGIIDESGFSEENYEYNTETGIVRINVENKEGEDGKVAWNKEAADEYIITYKYDVNTNEENIDINTKIKTIIEGINGSKIEGESDNNEYEIEGKIGEIVNSKIINNQEKLSKGYMYTNIEKNEGKMDTQFSQKYEIEVGWAQALDNVLVKETGEYLNDIDATGVIYTKKLKVNREELIKVLGENGEINVLKEDGSLIGTINKDTLEIEVNESKIRYELSKPIEEGTITLEVEKAIKGEASYTKEQIASFNTLTSKIEVNGETESKIELEEPSTKAGIEISNTNLSTVVKNEDVVITVTLERDDITDRLYKNPELIIEMPEEIKNIEFKDARLLYEDELVQEDFRIEGNRIYLKLKGTQTKYASKAVSKGTVIRIVLDITLDNLLPSKESNITLRYTNENETMGINTLSLATNSSNMKETSTSFNVVAPEGFVTTNTLSGYNGDESVTSQEGNVEVGNIPIFSEQKTMTVSGTIVNNLGTDANGLKILGRIPFIGNKEIGSNEDLGTTFDTIIDSRITHEGIDAITYYSTNGEADTDLEKEENAWVAEYVENAKSYMIVATAPVPHATKINIQYKVIIPSNLGYEQAAYANYGVYYSNEAQDGSSENLVLASKVGVKTESTPKIQSEITVKDLLTGEDISNGGNVTEGEYLSYNIKIKNTGSETANNVKVKMTLPTDSEITETGATEELCYLGKLIIQEESSTVETVFNKIYTINTQEKEIEETVESIEPGGERTITINLGVSGKVSILGEGLENTVRTTITADNLEGSSDNMFTTKLTKGYLLATLESNYDGLNVTQNQAVLLGVRVNNVNREEKTNVISKINIPQGIEYNNIRILPSENTSASFDENSRELTINFGTITANDSSTAEIMLDVTSSNNGQMDFKANVTCNETDKTISSNIISMYNNGENISATLTSNISEGTVLDTDELEYYIDLKNNGNYGITVSILDNIPKGLNCRSYKVEVTNGTGAKETDYTANQISTTVNLNAGGSARIIIRTATNILPEGEEKQITNTPVVTVDGRNIEINSITHTIIGSGGANNPNGQRNYRISGLVWIDENEDGRKDDNESRLGNITVTLYDQSTGNIAKDVNGNDVTTRTDGQGRYVFSNLNRGNYLVVVEYDTSNYEITTYQAEGVLESQNSDFIDAKLYDQKVAATNTIVTDNYNIYNIDLGLKEAKQFDLKIDKTIDRITVTNTKLDTRVHEYDNEKVAMVDLLNTYIEFSTVLVEYQITVTNEGAIPGYAREIVDYLPEGMAFASDLNEDWYLGQDGNLYTTSLANTLLNPGESRNITLILSRKMTGENTGTVRNIVEISKDYNEYGKADVDSVAGNNQDNEDDKSYADVILAMGTGKEVASFIGITIGVLTIVAFAVLLIKKYIIRKI